MLHAQEFQRHLDALALAGGLPALAASAEGVCALGVPDRFDLTLALEDEAGGIRLRAGLGPVPPERGEALYARMLSRNLFPPAPDPVFSLDAGLQACVSCRVSLRELESVTLAQVVQAFMGVAADWQDEMAAAPAAGQQPLSLALLQRA